MSRFDITYVIIAIAHANVGQDPFVKVDKMNLLPYETYLQIKFGNF